MNKQDYITTRKANGSVLTAEELSIEYDDLQALINPSEPIEPTPPENEKGVSDLVNTFLLKLKNSDNDEFERVRKLSYKEQYDLSIA